MQWRRKLLVMLIASCFWLLVAELGARVWRGLAADPLDRARRVMRTHEDRLWMMKPDLQTEFEGAALHTDEAGFRKSERESSDDFVVRVKNADVLLLGPSSAFGWGVRAEETYLSLALESVASRGVNLSQVGYGLQQGIETWRELALQVPELLESAKASRVILLAYGVNDIDRARFFVSNGRPDREFFGDQVADESRRIWRQQLERESQFISTALGQMLLRSLQELAFAVGCASPHKLETRSTPEEFVEVLLRWKTDLENLGHKVLVLDSPFRYPFAWDESLASQAEAWFAKSAEASQLGECGEARRWLREARRAEPHRVMMSLQQINLLLDKTFGASTTQAQSSLETQGDYLRIRDDLNSAEDFVDPIHFSVVGHRKVEAKLRPFLMRALQEVRAEK